MKFAARVGDQVMHPLPPVLQPGPGSNNVITGNKPQWRGIPALAAMALSAAKAVADAAITVVEAATVAAAGTPAAPAAIAAEKTAKAAAAAAMSAMINGAASLAGAATLGAGMPDIHICATPPLPPPPHGPGVDITGSQTVLVNGLPAGRAQDTILEAFGPTNTIMMGCTSVIIGDAGMSGLGLLDSLLAKIMNMLDKAKSLMDAVKEAAAGILALVTKLANKVIEFIKDAASKVKDAIKRTITKFMEALKKAFQQVKHAVRPTKVKGMSADDADKAIVKSQKDAVDALDKRIKDLDKWDPETQKSFKRWFGDDSEATRKTMRERMEKAKKNLEGKTLDNYESDDDYYAYVYPDKDDKMYLGSLYGKAPETGRDSKAGTMVHEASHYETVGETDDVKHEGKTVYGEKGAEKVAIDDPAKAQKNADNFEYFVEDGM